MSNKKDKATLPNSISSHLGKQVAPSSMRLPINRTPSSRYSCDFPECGKNFTRKNSLKRHKTTVHDKIKRFKCGECNKEFDQSYSLKLHIQRHTSEKPYGCEACGKKYADKATLRKHFFKIHFDRELVLKPHNQVTRSERPEDIKDDIKPLYSPSPARDIQDKEAEQQMGLVTEQGSQSSFSSFSLPREEELSPFPFTFLTPISVPGSTPTPLPPLPPLPLSEPLSPIMLEDTQDDDRESLFLISSPATETEPEPHIQNKEAKQPEALVTKEGSQSSLSSSSFSRKSLPSPNAGNSTSSNSFFSSAPSSSSSMSSSSAASSSLHLIMEMLTQYSIVPQSLPASSPMSSPIFTQEQTVETQISPIFVAQQSDMQNEQKSLLPTLSDFQQGLRKFFGEGYLNDPGALEQINRAYDIWGLRAIMEETFNKLYSMNPPLPYLGQFEALYAKLVDISIAILKESLCHLFGNCLNDSKTCQQIVGAPDIWELRRIIIAAYNNLHSMSTPSPYLSNIKQLYILLVSNSEVVLKNFLCVFFGKNCLNDPKTLQQIRSTFNVVDLKGIMEQAYQLNPSLLHINNFQAAYKIAINLIEMMALSLSPPPLSIPIQQSARTPTSMPIIIGAPTQYGIVPQSLSASSPTPAIVVSSHPQQISAPPPEKEEIKMGNRIFRCDFPKCGMEFPKNYNLTHHQKIHDENQRKRKCEECGRKFLESFQLKRHKRTHTGVKPFPCETCGKKYADNASLKKHKANKHHIFTQKSKSISNYSQALSYTNSTSPSELLEDPTTQAQNHISLM